MLTTNDVRVLRVLVEHGAHTRDELARELRHGFGSEAALRRLQPLRDRWMVCQPGVGLFDVTGEGRRALAAADRV